MSTLKLDGLFFVAGLAIGMLAFGETVPVFRTFWETSGYYGEITLPQWLRLPTGAVVMGVVVMALGMFVAAERVEAFFAARSGGGEEA